MLNYRRFDQGHIMESIIYNELIRRGYFVDIGVVTERKNDKRVYIQSAYQMDTEEKIEQELKSLKLTGDFFKKIIIRMDIPHSFYDNNGFFHCNLIEFLLNDSILF